MRPEYVVCCETILTGPFEISGGVLNFIATIEESAYACKLRAALELKLIPFICGL